MITFNHNNRTFQIGQPWRDGNSRPWRSLHMWTDNGWQFVISQSFWAGRSYFDGDTIQGLKKYARDHF